LNPGLYSFEGGDPGAIPGTGCHKKERTQLRNYFNAQGLRKNYLRYIYLEKEVIGWISQPSAPFFPRETGIAASAR
jgi:hypothetical protein